MELPNQRDKTEPTLPKCDWVYFAASSKGDWTVTGKFVKEEKIIIRNVHNKLGQRLSNNSHLRPGQKILLVHGGDGSFRALFCCTIVASTKPVQTPRPSFGIFLEIDKSMHAHLKETNYEPDPRLHKFVGISIAGVQDLRHITCSIPKPQGRNTLWRWNDVPWASI
jgi:hypothetical protein